MRYRKSFNLYLAASIIAVFASAWGGMETPPLPGSTVHANGFSVPLLEGDSGPYNYMVGIWPAVPIVRNLHIAIELTSERGPVTDAVVDVRGRIGLRGPLSEPVPAPGYFLRPWSYELDMRLSEPGRWVFEIQVDSSLGETVIEVPLVVAPGSGPETPGESGSRPFGGPNWILISGIVALLALGSGGWECISRQRAETRPNRRRRRR